MSLVVYALLVGASAHAGETGHIRFWGQAGLDAYIDGKKLGVTKKKPESFVAEKISAGKHTVKRIWGRVNNDKGYGDV